MKSIKSNLLAFAILATLIPSLGLGLLSFWSYQEVINRNVSHELHTLARESGSELTLWLRERVQEVRALSAANVIVDGLTVEPVPRSGLTRIGARELELYLRSVQKKLDPLLELTLYDAGGRIVASSAPAPVPIVLPLAWPNGAFTEGVVLPLPRWDNARATATVTVAVPVMSLRNELLGALAAVVDLDTIRTRLQSIVRASPAEVILLAADGTPLLSTLAAATALIPLDAQSLVRLRTQPEGAIAFQGHHGREVLAVAGKPLLLPMLVVAERDRAEIFGEWLRLLEFYVGLVAGLLLLVGVVAYWMGRSIVTPLNALTVAADRVARGDLPVALRDDCADEIGQLTRVFNLMTDRLRRSNADVEAVQRTLREQNELLGTLAITDGLTGLYNRKKLDEILADQFARFRRNHHPFALLMLDLDNFKAINDSYGHAAGDEVLVKVASILRQSVRDIDYVARYGGEEFAAVLAETTSEEALVVAERIRVGVDIPSIRAGNQVIAVTVSVGIAQSREGDDSPAMMLFRADHALYEAKREGRNRVRSAT
ncbi:MAG: diguanylate cyclase [Casimicrobiaceae bacterium]